MVGGEEGKVLWEWGGGGRSPRGKAASEMRPKVGEKRVQGGTSRAEA